MELSEEYRRQFAWRPWPAIFRALPPLEGRTVLDLGCGRGDLAAELASRGARVIGLDLNEDLLARARARGLARVEFRSHDLRAPLDLGIPVHGVWSSFAAAYFPDLPAALARWTTSLVPGGFVALTELDDLFGHEPLAARTVELLAAYAREALAAGRHDFQMGGKLARYLERAGFTVVRELALGDAELAFDGPAPAEVVEAWRNRFERMTLLRDFCGPDWESVRADFLGCLAGPRHRAAARVRCCIATR